MASFKAIELDRVSRQRTGHTYVLDVATRQEAIEALLRVLGVNPAAARIDPSRTLVQLETELWTIVGVTAPPAASETASLRRAGAKHKRVR